jgi:hypothetical protein
MSKIKRARKFTIMKPEGKREQLEISGCKRKDNIKTIVRNRV